MTGLEIRDSRFAKRTRAREFLPTSIPRPTNPQSRISNPGTEQWLPGNPFRRGRALQDGARRQRARQCRQRPPSARRAATSCSRRASAPRPSPRTACPSPGNRACRQVREHGRADGEGSRLQDVRQRRRRHHHRHRAGAGVHPRGHEGGRRRHEPDGPQARHRQGRVRGRRRTEEAQQAVRRPARKSPRSAPSPPTATPTSAT